MAPGADETLDLMLCGEEAVTDESCFQPVPHDGGPLKMIPPRAQSGCVRADSQQPSASPHLSSVLPLTSMRYKRFKAASLPSS